MSTANNSMNDNIHCIKKQKIKILEHQIETLLISHGHYPGKPCNYSLTLARQINKIKKQINEIEFGSKAKQSKNRKKRRNKLSNFIKIYYKMYYGNVKKGNECELNIRKKCRYALCIQQNNICAICGHQMSNNDITFEHIVPFSKGGETSILNGKAVHHDCNQYIGVLSLKRKMNMFID